MIDAQGNLVDDGVRFELRENPVLEARIWRVVRYLLPALGIALLVASLTGCASTQEPTAPQAGPRAVVSFDEEVTIEEIEILFENLEATWEQMDSRSIEGTTTLRGGAASNLSENQILPEIERKVQALPEKRRVETLKRLVRLLVARKAKLERANTEFLMNGDSRDDEDFVGYGAEMNLRTVSVNRSIERYRSWIRNLGG